MCNTLKETQASDDYSSVSASVLNIIKNRLSYQLRSRGIVRDWADEVECGSAIGEEEVFARKVEV